MRGSIRKRGNAWTLSVYLGTKDGKKQYKYETFHGKKTDAEKRLNQLVNEVSTQGITDPGKITVEQFIKKWLSDYCETNVAKSTYLVYEGIVNNHIVPEIGKVALSKLSGFELQGYFSRLSKLELSTSTMQSHYKVLKSALNKAVKWRLISVNPCNFIDPPKNKKREYVQLTPEQISKTIEYASKNDSCAFMLMPVILSAHLGMRKGEVLGLTWDCVDFFNNIVTIKRQYIREGTPKLVERTKSGEQRKVLMPEELAKILKEHHKEQSANRLKLGEGYDKREFVCCLKDGSPIEPTKLSQKFTSVTDKLGFKSRFHDLRHYFATDLLENNIELGIVSSILGHSSISITNDVYGHIKTSAQQKAFDVVNNKLKALNK